MDWSKAKNILIVAFIATNIFLIYNVQSRLFRQEEMQLINDKYISNVEQHLNDNNIELDAHIPREIISLPILVVRYKTFDSDNTAKSFLGKDYEKQIPTLEDKILKREIFKSADKELIVESSKRLTYKNMSPEKNNYSLNEKTVKKISNDFLKQYNLMGEDIELAQIYYGTEDEFEDEFVYKLVYNQTYKNKFLGESYIHVYVSNRGVIGFEAMLLEYEKTQQHKKQIIPATEALMRATSTILKENEEPIIVKDIEIGYYFSPTYYMESDWKEIESGTAFPSWKITIQNGKTYFIEAYKN
ncbi:two-component system regulatory protein YycI [Alkaliphilus sp. MSJ-5]|uniref:Two-component system regulatory protein YycI n=1 Tax=Alkaliphilus flagellatus TaxID=2841507 RepID=A0ABS6G1W5_9FIRM|nr:two-component system regulatory protein YycI [Alkaliphilus flagellatus]MBU5676364.1 two-component system regulatory protein YycI [Alkaliphilus flagellatus]